MLDRGVGNVDEADDMILISDIIPDPDAPQILNRVPVEGPSDLRKRIPGPDALQ